MVSKPTKRVFWALLGSFILLIIAFTLMNPPLRTVLNRSFSDITIAYIVSTLFGLSGLLFFSLGLALLILTIREKPDRNLKIFLILTGSAAVGLPASLVLHNAVYALFTLLLGPNFWERTGIGDEPAFFIMGLIICPLAYLVGAVGSIVLIMRGRKQETQAA